MKKWRLLVVVAIAFCALVWFRFSPEPESALTGSDPSRPSPIDAELPRPRVVIEKETVRTRVAEAPVEPKARAPQAVLGGSDWAVVTAIYKEYDAAERRADRLRAESQFQPKVHPEKGQGTKYMVVLGSNLTHVKALELRDGAIGAGLPADTYVTRLTAAPAP